MQRFDQMRIQCRTMLRQIVIFHLIAFFQNRKQHGQLMIRENCFCQLIHRHPHRTVHILFRHFFAKLWNGNRTPCGSNLAGAVPKGAVHIKNDSCFHLFIPLFFVFLFFLKNFSQVESMFFLKNTRILYYK